MKRSKSFRDLIVWQKAHQLVLDIYEMNLCLPENEKYGISNQIKRSSVSVPANIAEGFGRISTKEKLRFFYIANGSLEETRYFLILINDLKFTQTEQLQKKLTEVSKILNSYISRIKNEHNDK